MHTRITVSLFLSKKKKYLRFTKRMESIEKKKVKMIANESSSFQKEKKRRKKKKREEETITRNGSVVALLLFSDKKKKMSGQKGSKPLRCTKKKNGGCFLEEGI